MKKILPKHKVQKGIEQLIAEQLYIMEKLNNTGAYKLEECEERIDLIRQRDRNDYILKYLFDLQSFEYMKEDFSIEIR